MRGDEALAEFRKIRPDAVILDINLPGQDGLSILRALRAESSVPILMLSARDDQNNISTSFEFEADDYIGKPFSPREVVMRIKAVLRRGTSQPRPVFAFRDWEKPPSHLIKQSERATMPRTRIKICGIRDVDTALAAGICRSGGRGMSCRRRGACVIEGGHCSLQCGFGLIVPGQHRNFQCSNYESLCMKCKAFKWFFA